jgi:hypothetical protein
MKPTKISLITGLLLVCLGSHAALAVDSEALGDELKKARKSVRTEKPMKPRALTIADAGSLRR